MNDLAGIPAELVLGQQIRRHRMQRGWTLKELGRRVGRPASLLSMHENGERAPSPETRARLARVFEVEPQALQEGEGLSQRALLEMRYAALRTREDAPASELRLPRLARQVPDALIEDLLALHARAVAQDRLDSRLRDADQALRELREEQQSRGNYFPAIEQAARGALEAIGYPGRGVIGQRDLRELTARIGYRIEAIRGMPHTIQAAIDSRNKVLYVPARNELRTRQARSVIAHNLGHLYLHHPRPRSLLEKLRQRMEANYFAAALFLPEAAVVRQLDELRREGDLAIDELRQSFYVTYEMAAHRFTNLVTHHFEIPVHFLRMDDVGRISKFYQNDGLRLPELTGLLQARRPCKSWAAYAVLHGAHRFEAIYQLSRGPQGDFFCGAHVSQEAAGFSITVGCRQEHARFFRGSREAPAREVSDSRRSCRRPECCFRPSEETARSFRGKLRVSARRGSDLHEVITGASVSDEDRAELSELLRRLGGGR